MPKHIFDGPWKFYLIDDRHYPPGLPRKSTMTLVIPDSNAGKIDKGSKHKKTDDMTGNASKDAQHIKMREQDPQNLIDISYEGHRVGDDDNHLVLVGTWKNNAVPLALKRRRIFADGQNDGTWVMTKP